MMVASLNHRAGWLMVMMIAWANAAAADDPVAGQRSKDVPSQDQSSLDPPPTELPSSTLSLRPIFFYQSQAAELLPSTFRPIELSTLDERLRGQNQSAVNAAASSSSSPQLIRSVYVATVDGEQLVSPRSTWDVAYRGEGSSRLNVGKLGIALRPQVRENSDATDRFFSDGDGGTSVVVNGDTRIGFAWSSRGRGIERGVLFDLEIPASIQTRFLIEVPSKFSLRAIDGVGRALPSPPPEAGTSVTAAVPTFPTAWYSIEAGGLTRVRLKVTSGKIADAETVLPVRQASIQYDLMPQAIRFVTRMLVDSRPDSTLPVLSIDQGSVTSVRVGGIAVPWGEVMYPDGNGIRIDASRLESSSASGTMNVTIEGEAPWSVGGGLQSLPWPRWRGCRPILIATEMQTQVRIDESITALRLQLPDHWRFLPSTSGEDRSRLYRAVGSLGDEGPAVLVRPEEKQSPADSILRLSATRSQLKAQLDASIVVDEFGPKPIQMRVDPMWNADLVTITSSGRVIELPADAAARRTITIWPTSDEVLAGRIPVRVTGWMPLRTIGGSVEFPATSFLTIQNSRNRLAALVTPPIGFNWTGDVAIRTKRVVAKDLSPIQQTLLGDLSEDSLLLELPDGRLESLVCRRPEVNLDATIRFALRRDGDRLIETCVIGCDSISTDVQSLVVDLGEHRNRPVMQWSAIRADGSSRRMDARPDAAPTEICRIDLGTRGERQVLLLGKREYPIGDGCTVPLPVVPEATNQSCQAIVMPTLSITRQGPTMLRVPAATPAKPPGKPQSQWLVTMLADIDPAPGSVVLRYESTDRSSIDVVASESPKAVTVVWQESVQINASNRGGDTIIATYDVDPSSTITINHDAVLRLVSVTDPGGKTIPHESEPGQLRVNTPSNVSQWMVTWTRNVYSNSMFRRWSAPKVQVTGVVLRRAWVLTPAPDTMVPAASLFGRPTAADGSLSPPAVMSWQSNFWAHQGDVEMDINAGKDRVWILDSAIGYPVAAMIGMCLFAANWWIALRSRFVAFTLWCFSVLPVLLLFSTDAIWVASVCVPLAAGGVIATTATSSVKGQRRSRPSSGRSAKPITAKLLTQAPASWPTTLPLWFLAILTIDAVARCEPIASAQSITDAAAVVGSKRDDAMARAPFMLVPTDESGAIAGTKVYIPKNYYVELMRDGLPSITPARFQSVAYRLRLEGLAGSKTSAELEARFQIQDSDASSDAKFPFLPSQVRSVQWLTDTDSRPLRWIAEADNSVRLTLPPASNASLLIRLGVDVQTLSETGRRVRVGIPGIASASLLVDAGGAVQRMELLDSLGSVDVQTDVGRINASIGAVKNIDLSFAYRDVSNSIATLAARRYWVHSGPVQTNIECEVDVIESSIRKDDEVSLVMIGDQNPLITSPDWALTSVQSVAGLRSQLNFRAKRDDPGPVRMLWETPSTIVAANSPIFLPLILPDIQSTGLPASVPTSIALDAAQGLLLSVQPRLPALIDLVPADRTVPVNVMELATKGLSGTLPRVAGDPSLNLGTRSETNAEAIDAFVSNWKGYRGTATEILTSTTSLPRLILTSDASTPWRADEIRHLHVRPGELQLTYAATITPGTYPLGPLRVILPVGGELRTLTMNKASIDTVPRRVGNRDEVILPSPVGAMGIGLEPFTLRAVIRMRVSQNDKFNPPMIYVEPIEIATGTYTLTRDQSLSVEEVVDSRLSIAPDPNIATDDQLNGGWVPCWTWKTDRAQTQPSDDPSRRPQLSGVYRVTSRDMSMDSQQRTALQWGQNRWSFETIIQLHRDTKTNDPATESDHAIDFVNIELPSMWCGNLEIEPDMPWSRQPSIDPSTQIVRIRPEARSATETTLEIRLRGQRMTDADARIEVPTIRVLGAGEREMYFTVPEQIDGRLVQWEANAAVISPFPDHLNLLPGQQKAGLTYRALSGNAALRLAPSPIETTDPRATIADIVLLASENQQTTLFCRWDISPGRKDSIDFQVPESLDVLGLWSDDQAIHFRTHDNGIRVALPLSRLAQSVVMVCKTRDTARTGSLPLPTILDVPVNETWMTVYEPDDALSTIKATIIANHRWSLSDANSRTVASAKSIRAATESSLQRVTERSQDQVAKWIQTWDTRFKELVFTPIKGDSTSDVWNDQVRKWNQYVRRIAGDVVETNVSSAARLSPPAQWRVIAVAVHKGSATTSPNIHVSRRSTMLTRIIETLVVIVILAGCYFLLWHRRDTLLPFASHPSTWLLAMGLSSLAAAPIAVSISICLVAITAPWIMRASSTGFRRAG